MPIMVKASLVPKLIDYLVVRYKIMRNAQIMLRFRRTEDYSRENRSL